MAVKTTNDWDLWEQFCLDHDEDPYETFELSFDLGGGNTDDYEFTGDIPEREED